MGKRLNLYFAFIVLIWFSSSSLVFSQTSVPTYIVVDVRSNTSNADNTNSNFDEENYNIDSNYDNPASGSYKQRGQAYILHFTNKLSSIKY